MSDADQPPVETDGYDDFWGFLEEGGFDTPVPIASKAFPYLRDDENRVQRDSHGRPLGGKVYHVASPDAKTGLRLTALADIAKASKAGVKVKPEDVAKLSMDDAEEREFAQQVLGDTYAEMMADGVDWTIIQRVVQYGYIFFSMGEDVAKRAAKEGLFTGGKARVPANRAERRGGPQDHQTRRTRRTQ